MEVVVTLQIEPVHAHRVQQAFGAQVRFENAATQLGLINLHHQGDVGEASYAAVPHLVRICRDAARRDWNLYGLAGLIEIERHRKSNPPIPDWLNADYLAAWGDLEKLALRDLADASERELIQTALAVVALARGQLRLGAFLAWLDEGELAELTEDRLAWSTLYV